MANPPYSIEKDFNELDKKHIHALANVLGYSDYIIAGVGVDGHLHLHSSTSLDIRGNEIILEEALKIINTIKKQNSH